MDRNWANYRAYVAIMLVMLAVFGQTVTPATEAAQQTPNQNTSGASTATDANPLEAVVQVPSTSVIFSASFGEASDLNYDDWPDDWKRLIAPGFPHYIDARLRQDAAGEASLCVKLNGGRFGASGPVFPINPRLSYQFSARVRNLGQQDSGYLAVRWLDAQRQPVQEVNSSQAMPANGWQTVAVSSIAAPQTARFAQPVLMTNTGDLPDLTGEIWFDDVLMTCAPRIDLALDRTREQAHLYRADEPVSVRVAVNGIFAHATGVSLRVAVTDVSGNIVVQPSEFALTSVALHGQDLNDVKGTQAEFQTEINVPAVGAGYYRLSATLLDQGEPVISRKIAWAAINDLEDRLPLDFSWSAEDGAGPLTELQLVDLAAAAGIGWLKYPIWPSPDDAKRIARLANLADELSTHDIRVVGLLNHPPQAVLDLFPDGTPRDAAGVLSLPVDAWYPHLLPTQRRIAMSVRRWQLGSDDDLSLVGFRNLPARIREVKAALDRLGHDVELVVAWNWLYPLPTVSTSPSNPGKTPWSQVSLSAAPPLSPAEMARYLSATQTPASGQAAAQRWVNVEALPSPGYSIEAQATHLAKQIIAAKAGGADGVNLPRALTAAQGMIHEDGSPAELFLVWRTLARQLSGAKFIGSFRLPGGSQNLVFSRAGQAMMFVWNDNPIQETIYLGENVSHVDLWGRTQPLEDIEDEQSFLVGPTPSILTNLNAMIASFRMTVQLEKQIVPAVFGRTFANSIAWGNPYPYPIAGRVTIPTPTGWDVSTGSGEFRLQEGEATSEAFYANFPHSAETGKQLLKLDFRVVADRDYRFSVYRDIEVGMAELEWDVICRIDANDVLYIELRLRNYSERPKRVRAVLYAPNRQRRATPLLIAEPGINYHEMQLNDAGDLRGQTIRILLEEPGTNRFLNKRITLGN